MKLRVDSPRDTRRGPRPHTRALAPGNGATACATEALGRDRWLLLELVKYASSLSGRGRRPRPSWRWDSISESVASGSRNSSISDPSSFSTRGPLGFGRTATRPSRSASRTAGYPLETCLANEFWADHPDQLRGCSRRVRNRARPGTESRPGISPEPRVLRIPARTSANRGPEKRQKKRREPEGSWLCVWQLGLPGSIQAGSVWPGERPCANSSSRSRI